MTDNLILKQELPEWPNEEPPQYRIITWFHKTTLPAGSGPVLDSEARWAVNADWADWWQQRAIESEAARCKWQDKADEARAALWRYGRHDDGCSWSVPYDPPRGFHRRPCSCGLDAAIDAARATLEPNSNSDGEAVVTNDPSLREVPTVRVHAEEFRGTDTQSEARPVSATAHFGEKP